MQTMSLGLIVFFSILFIIAFFARTKTQSNEDFLVGGRSFSLSLSTLSLLATWFGAGTLISATDEISQNGIQSSLLEPYGSGVCLILASFMIAKKLWEMNLLTYSDFFKEKFGKKMELFSAFTTIPAFIGWISVQYLALAEIIALFTPISPFWAIIILSIITCTLTMLGGMWSVSLTDSLQMFIIIFGLIYLAIKIYFQFDLSLIQMFEIISAEKKSFDIKDVSKLYTLLSIFSIAALGNMTGQDLGQRIFAAKSAKIAQKACLIAGFAYIIIGSIPVWLGLITNITLPEQNQHLNILSLLIEKFLDPISSMILLLAIISAILSTITSALLAPSSILANNLLNYIFQKTNPLILCKISVIFISLISLIICFLESNIYTLLESSYAIGFVGFFPALIIGLYSKNLNEKSMILTLVIGLTSWVFLKTLKIEISYELIIVTLSFPLYFILTKLLNRKS